MEETRATLPFPQGRTKFCRVSPDSVMCVCDVGSRGEADDAVALLLLMRSIIDLQWRRAVVEERKSVSNFQFAYYNAFGTKGGKADASLATGFDRQFCSVLYCM